MMILPGIAVFAFVGLILFSLVSIAGVYLRSITPREDPYMLMTEEELREEARRRQVI